MATTTEPLLDHSDDQTPSVSRRASAHDILPPLPTFDSSQATRLSKINTSASDSQDGSPGGVPRMDTPITPPTAKGKHTSPPSPTIRSNSKQSVTPSYQGSELVRKTSKPPVVCPMGSVTPADDDMEGYIPARTAEQALTRERSRSRGYSISRTRSNASTGTRPGQPHRSMSLREAMGGDPPAGQDAGDAEKGLPGTKEREGENPDNGAGSDSSSETFVDENGIELNEDEKKKIIDERHMVRWEPGEKANPKNWTVAYRWFITACASLLVLNSTFASSAPSGIVTDMQAYFGFGSEVATLCIALFIAGYCVGPLAWGPASESFGRKPVFLVTFTFYTGFQVGCALSKNTASILIFRLLGGIFAAAPLTNAGGILADIWDADRRGIAMSFFALAPFAGPAFGPIVGGFISVTGTDWRWLYWVLTLFAGFCFLVVLFLIPETYTPKLLQDKAIKMRKETGNEQFWAPLERKDHALKDRLRDIAVKPFQILFLEPMLLSITIYMSFVYGCVYLLFEAVPIVYVEGHNFNAGESGLIFLFFFGGGALSVAFFIAVINSRYIKKAHHHHPGPVPPEARLEMTLICSPLFFIAFMIFGWTSYPTITWVAPSIGLLVLGFATLGIFVSLFNYIVDVYLFAAASALAANTVCRSIFGAVFPLFASQMYIALNPRWASTLIAGIALLLGPIPFVLIKYGHVLRAKSRYSPNKK